MGYRNAVSKQFAVPAHSVWQLITDTRTWPVWGPTVRAVDCPDRFLQASTRGRVQTSVGIWLPFTVERFETGCYWDWRVAGVTATGHRVDATGIDNCRLTFTIPPWAVGYGLVCRLALNRIQQLLP